MKKLTLDILDSITPEYNNYQGILPHTARYNEYTSQFSLNNQAWEHHFSGLKSITFNWKDLRYEDVVERKIKIKSVVPNEIGIYLFVVRPMELICGLPQFVYYVGIAGAHGKGRTLQERIPDYFSASQLKKRDAVRILIHKHYKNVFIYFSEISVPVGMTIEMIEKALIGFYGTHLLANRDDIPTELQPQGKAFNI